jgi:hypothetical protein
MSGESLEKYKSWKRELEENIKNEPSVTPPQNYSSPALWNIERNQHFHRRNFLLDLIRQWEYDEKKYNNISNSSISYNNDELKAFESDDLTRLRSLTGGKVKVYTGPKNGKYIIKNGSKVYIDRKSLSNNGKYIKGRSNKK